MTVFVELPLTKPLGMLKKSISGTACACCFINLCLRDLVRASWVVSKTTTLLLKGEINFKIRQQQGVFKSEKSIELFLRFSNFLILWRAPTYRLVTWESLERDGRWVGMGGRIKLTTDS